MLITTMFIQLSEFMDNQLAKHCTVNFRLLVMDTSMHTQKPCSGGTIEVNHIVCISTTAVFGLVVQNRWRMLKFGEYFWAEPTAW